MLQVMEFRQSKQIVQNPIEHSLMRGQSKISTAEVFVQKILTSK